MVFRVSNAIIVAGISIDNARIRTLRLCNLATPLVHGARPTLLCSTVQLLFRSAGSLRSPAVIDSTPPAKTKRNRSC